MGKENIESREEESRKSNSWGAAMFFVDVNNSGDFTISEWNVRKGDFESLVVPK